MREYNEAPFERRTEWATEGDIVRITGPDVDHHLVVHPDYIEEVLFDEERFEKLDTFESVFGDGVFTVYGDQWRAQRRGISPAFAPEMIESYAETIREITAQAVAEIEDGETRDTRELFVDLTVRVMLETLFGGAGDQTEPIADAAERITEYFLESATGGEVSPDVQSQFDASRERLIELIDEMIHKHDGADPEGDLLSVMVALGPDSDANYTDERIRDEMITMLFAAHETTALTLAYTMYLLADAPEVERRLRAELTDALDGAAPGPDHLDELTYTEKVIDEALRLYCPAHALYRVTRRDVEIGGCVVPEGDVLHLSQWVVHRDERWWDDPTEFRPERFEGDNDRPRFAFFPFGAGPRRCIGEAFARAEAKLVVAAFLDEFTVDRVTESFDLRAGPTAVPDRPIELIFHTRG